MNKKGFTLVELLAVIVILTLLLLIVVPSIMSVLDRAEIQFTEAQERLILQAATQYIEDNKETIAQLKEPTVNYVITLKTLGNGYITLPLYDAKTRKEINPENVTVTVTKNSYGRFEFQISGVR